MHTLEPGSYNLEIRASGYKTFSGSVKISTGSTTNVEEELREKMSTEEMLLLGKIPRKKTEPQIAFRKALIPGQGQSYNGNQNAGLILPAEILMNSLLGCFMGYQYLQEKEEVNSVGIHGYSF